MKLYVTMTSPYARMARVVLIEKRLEGRVDVVPATTRTPGSPYYSINPSGRVPFLVMDNGAGFEGSQLICQLLDQVDGTPQFATPTGTAALEFRRLEEKARSLMDGLSVWLRETKRPAEDQSAMIIEHERRRAARLADYWEAEIAHPMMNGAFNMPQLTLACALLLDHWSEGRQWRESRPKLSEWADRQAERPSMAKTSPG